MTSLHFDARAGRGRQNVLAPEAFVPLQSSPDCNPLLFSLNHLDSGIQIHLGPHKT